MKLLPQCRARVFTLKDLTFANNALEWWITGKNMGDLPAEITSVTPAMRATLNQGSLPRAFAYEVKENLGVARTIELEIYITNIANADPLTTIPITLVQAAPILGVLSTNAYAISSDPAISNTELELSLSLQNSGRYWWVTGDDGSVLTTFLPKADPKTDARSDTEHFLNYTVAENAGSTDKVIDMVLHIAKIADPDPSVDAITAIPFTITQSKKTHYGYWLCYWYHKRCSWHI